jgi:hypothetical protein
MKELVFVHGRSQQGRPPAEIKQQWTDALKRGFAGIGKTLPIPDASIRLPFYGDALDDLVHDLTPAQAASVIAQGAGAEDPQGRYAADAKEMIREIAARNHIQPIEEQDLTDEDLAGDTVVQQGAENWRITLALLRALDKVPGINSQAVAIAARDVFRYLRQVGVSIPINKGVMDVLQPNTETVVVSHSLGTVVCYNLLRTPNTNLKITQLVTLGSPLAITPIKRALAPLGWPPTVVGNWFNARDPRDVVALFPLTPDKFPPQPITDKSTVKNSQNHPHSIEDYLADPDVARCIYNALL